jgi:hypothetical protein
VLESLGDVCERFGAFDRAFDALERARELGRSRVPLLDARLLGKEGALHELMGRYPKLSQRATRASPASRRRRRPRPRRCPRGRRATAGTINYRQTNNREAIRWLEAAAEHAERAGDRSTLAHAYYMLDAAHSDFGSPDGLHYLELAGRSTRNSATFAVSASSCRTSEFMRTTKDAGTNRWRSTARAVTRKSGRAT